MIIKSNTFQCETEVGETISYQCFFIRTGFRIRYHRVNDLPCEISLTESGCTINYFADGTYYRGCGLPNSITTYHCYRELHC